MICQYCKDELRFIPGRGWTHSQGGVYRMKCPECGWEGAPWPSPKVCPVCGSAEVRDEHCALPVPGAEGKS